VFAGYYIVISVDCVWYYRSVVFKSVKDFLLGILLPLADAATLVYVIVKCSRPRRSRC
jgi:hypothetical protein